MKKKAGECPIILSYFKQSLIEFVLSRRGYALRLSACGTCYSKFLALPLDVRDCKARVSTKG